VLGEGDGASRCRSIRIVAPEGKYDLQNKYFTDDVKYLVPERPAAARKSRDPATRARRATACSGAAAGAGPT
jgi:D-alanine-D-alanine ligase